MNVLKTFGVKERKGEVGIEIEVEGRNLPKRDVVGWECEHDGSLRGEAIEYVLRNPSPVDKVGHWMDTLNEALVKSEAQVDYTGRAGVHVHINVQQLTMREVVTFLCLYFTFEEALIEWCGEGRSGNLFCLRGVDADYLITALREATRKRNWHGLGSNKFRYAAVNVKALSTYGSLEFRAMRSTVDKAIIIRWVDILLRLKAAAIKYADPQVMVQALSYEGPEKMFFGVFGVDTPLHFCFQDVMEGVRLAQHIAYSLDDWDVGPAQELREELGEIDRHYEYVARLTRWLASEDAYEEEGAETVRAYVGHYKGWLIKQQRHRPQPIGIDLGRAPRPRPVVLDDFADEVEEEHEWDEDEGEE